MAWVLLLLMLWLAFMASDSTVSRPEPPNCPDCTQWKLVYLDGFRETNGTIRDWRIRASYATRAETDSILTLAREGRLPWAKETLSKGPAQWITFPISLNLPAVPDSLAIPSDEMKIVQRTVPDWLKQLQRSDPRLSLKTLRRSIVLPVEINSPPVPPLSKDALHPLKWKRGILSRSPNKQFILDLRADLEMGADGEFGGDIDGAVALYNPDGQLLWLWTPGMYGWPGPAVWADNDTVVIPGSINFFHPVDLELECHIPAIWILDLKAGRFTGWSAPPGPYFPIGRG